MTAGGRAFEDDRARSDGELVEALVGGDLAALGALYRRHASLAYGLALRMTGDPSRAEDVVQSAFMSLWNDRAEPAGGTDQVRLRLVQLVAGAALDNIRRERKLRGPGAIKPRAGLVMRHSVPGLPQGS